MVIIPTVLLGILLVEAFTKWINDGVPTYKQRICLWPVEIIYVLPRIIAPFLIVYPMIIVKPMWCFLVWILLYLLSFWIKNLFWKVAYWINTLHH